MTILALDLSLTATGWAYSTGESGTLIPPKDVRGIARLRWYRNLIRSHLDIHLAVLEGYAYGIKAASALVDLSELGGVVRLELSDKGIPFVDVPPASLKLFATGKGNAPKDQVLAAAIRRLGYAGHDHNTADALWLLSMALVRTADPARLTEYQRRALEKIVWPDAPTP